MEDVALVQPLISFYTVFQFEKFLFFVTMCFCLGRETKHKRKHLEIVKKMLGIFARLVKEVANLPQSL